MANWQLRLQLGDVYHSGLPIPELAKIVAERLAALKITALMLVAASDLEDIRTEIVEEFQALSADPESDADNFDAVMERLYDWADIALDETWNGRKVCWVDTTMKAVSA